MAADSAAQQEEADKDAAQEMGVNAQGQQVKKIKGPKPRGLTKFKAIAQEE